MARNIANRSRTIAYQPSSSRFIASSAAIAARIQNPDACRNDGEIAGSSPNSRWGVTYRRFSTIDSAITAASAIRRNRPHANGFNCSSRMRRNAGRIAAEDDKARMRLPGMKSGLYAGSGGAAGAVCGAASTLPSISYRPP